MKTMNWVLVSQLDGKPVSASDEVRTKAGDTMWVTGWQEPKHEASTGRVYVSKAKEITAAGTGYFPAVFQLAFIAVEETI